MATDDAETPEAGLLKLLEDETLEVSLSLILVKVMPELDDVVNDPFFASEDSTVWRVEMVLLSLVIGTLPVEMLLVSIAIELVVVNMNNGFVIDCEIIDETVAVCDGTEVLPPVFSRLPEDEELDCISPSIMLVDGV